MRQKHRHHCRDFRHVVVERERRLHMLSECKECLTRRYMRHLSGSEAELGRFRDGTRFTVEERQDAAI